MKRHVLIGSAAAALGLAALVAATSSHARAGGPDGMRGEGIQMLFEAVDANQDGKVTADEIEAHRAASFSDLDTDGNGEVSRQEFIDHASARAGERAGTMFDRLDADGDGVLSRDAIEAQGRPGPDPARIIARFDTDGDGAISTEEAEQARTAFREHRGHRDGSQFGEHGRFGGRHDR